MKTQSRKGCVRSSSSSFVDMARRRAARGELMLSATRPRPVASRRSPPWPGVQSGRCSPATGTGHRSLHDRAAPPHREASRTDRHSLWLKTGAARARCHPWSHGEARAAVRVAPASTNASTSDRRGGPLRDELRWRPRVASGPRSATSTLRLPPQGTPCWSASSCRMVIVVLHEGRSSSSPSSQPSVVYDLCFLMLHEAIWDVSSCAIRCCTNWLRCFIWGVRCFIKWFEMSQLVVSRCCNVSNTCCKCLILKLHFHWDVSNGFLNVPCNSNRMSRQVFSRLQSNI
jgi:hypothetical protein